jgi:hypothetical protein
MPVPRAGDTGAEPGPGGASYSRVSLGVERAVRAGLGDGSRGGVAFWEAF